MPFLPITVEIIIQEEMNFLPCIEPISMPFGDFPGSFGAIETPGVRYCTRHILMLIDTDRELDARC